MEDRAIGCGGDQCVKQSDGGRIISYGVSSYGYDARVAPEFRIFTNINTAIVDPKNFDSESLVEKETDVVLKFPEVEKLSPPILMLSDVSYSYDNNRTIFSKVDLSATMESRICIVSGSEDIFKSRWNFSIFASSDSFSFAFSNDCSSSGCVTRA